MASLAQPTSGSPRKLLSVRDRWRGKTNYGPKRFTGYAPISFAMVAEVGRLTAGKATQLLYVILTASLGQIVKQTEPFKELAADLKTSELAELCGCDDRTIQRELGDLARRNVIIWEQSKKGVNVVTPLFRSWERLSDYKPAPVAEPEPEPEDEPTPEDPAQNAKVTTQVTKKPVHVAAGKKSKAYPVDCGVSSLQFDVRKLDADCSAVVKDGVLLVTLEPKWEAKQGVEGLQKAKGIQANMRQGCRISPSESTGKERKGDRRTSGENKVIHPRGEELSSLFDPLIHKWCGKTLSGDSQTLLKACNAIGDTPHDQLVKDVIERAGRRLTLLHVEAFCKEAAHNWQAGKRIPAQSTKAPLTDPSKVNKWDPLWWKKEKAQ